MFGKTCIPKWVSFKNKENYFLKHLVLSKLYSQYVIQTSPVSLRHIIYAECVRNRKINIKYKTNIDKVQELNIIIY